jgi:hypothetical protein
MEVLAARLKVPPENAYVAFGKLGKIEPNYQVAYAEHSFLFDGGTHHPYSLPNAAKTINQFIIGEFHPGHLGTERWSYNEICLYSDADLSENAPEDFEQGLSDDLMRMSLPASVKQDPKGAKRRLEEYRRQSRDRAFTHRLLAKQSKPNHCAVCDITIRECLQGAHVDEIKHGGDDTVTNGIVLCGSHHLMFDKHLFGIDPETRAIVVAQKHARKEMRIICEIIDEPVGLEELRRRWEKFQESEKSRICT